MANVQHIIEDAVRAALGPVPIETIDVAFGHDQGDEEAYFVAIDVPPGTPRLGGERSLATITGVNGALTASGEGRFAYAHVRYPDEEVADEGGPARSSDP